MLSWCCIISGHLGEDLLSLRVCSSAGATSCRLVIFVIDLHIISWSCRLNYFAILSGICTCFRDFGACGIKYVVISVIVDGVHVLQLQSLAFPEIGFGLLFASVLSTIGMCLCISDV